MIWFTFEILDANKKNCLSAEMLYSCKSYIYSLFITKILRLINDLKWLLVINENSKIIFEFFKLNYSTYD